MSAISGWFDLLLNPAWLHDRPEEVRRARILGRVACLWPAGAIITLSLFPIQPITIVTSVLSFLVLFSLRAFYQTKIAAIFFVSVFACAYTTNVILAGSPPQYLLVASLISLSLLLEVIGGVGVWTAVSILCLGVIHIGVNWCRPDVNPEVFRADQIGSVMLVFFMGTGMSVVQKFNRDRRNELKVQHARFRRVAENAFPIVGEVEAQEGNPIGKFLYLSPKIEELLGYPASDFLSGAVSFDSLLPTDNPTVDRLQDLAWTSFAPGRGSFPLRHRSGEFIWVESQLFPAYRSENGKIVRLFGLRDITQEREESRRMEAAQRMESLGQLAGGVAHDFNNLLTVISGRAEELPDSEASRDIQNATRRAGELTSRLLAVGRDQQSAPVSLNLLDFFKPIGGMLSSAAREDVTVEFDLPTDLWNIRFDENQLVQVVLNLVTNARDAMPSGGTLVIRGRNIAAGDSRLRRYTLNEISDWVELSFEDDGEGMTPRVIHHAFEPFFTTKEQGLGSGLGLSTTYGIVEQAGGSMAIQSREGLGTSISLLLRRSRETRRPQTRRETPPARPSSQGSILVVEDQPELRMIIGKMLHKGGYNVAVASSAEEGLQTFETLDDVSALVCDVVMPAMRGPELARVLRKKRPGLAVLFISGYTDRELGDIEVMSEPTDFLRKPFTSDQLLDSLANLLPSETGPTDPRLLN